MSVSGIFFRVTRGTTHENVAFEDLTEAEQDEMMMDRSEAWLKSLAKQLAGIITELESAILQE
jgi:hypothetical protein